MPTGARTSWYTPGAGSLPRRRGTRGLLGRAGMHPPPPPCPPCCVLAPKQLYRERHLNPTGDVLGCSNTPRASCKAGGHRGLGVGAGTRRPAELCLRQRARGCADPMEMGAPCPAGHMCRRGVGLTPLGGGGGGRAAPHTPGTVPVSPAPGLTATALQAAATGARWGPVPGSRQPKHAAVALPRRRPADAGEQTEAIPRRAQARWKPGTAGAPATATTPGTGFSGAAGAACLRSCCRAACKQAAAAAATASTPPPTSPGCRHPSACRRGQYSPLHQGKLCRGAGRDGDAGQPCREPGRGSSVARWPVATGNASLMPLLS